MSCFLTRIKITSIHRYANASKQLIATNLSIRTMTKCADWRLDANQMTLKSNNSFGHDVKLIRSLFTGQKKPLFLALPSSDLFAVQKRFKKMKKGGKQKKEELSEEEDSDEESSQSMEDDPDFIDGKAMDFRDISTTLPSLRLDAVAKVGLNFTRAKVDEAFYDSRIRVNGYLFGKKSAEVNEGDEIDFIKGLNVENNEMLDVARVVVKNVEDKMSSSGRVRVKLRKFANLTIHNYKEPYTGLLLNIHKKDEDERKPR